MKLSHLLIAAGVVVFVAVASGVAWYTLQQDGGATYSGPAATLAIANVGEYSIFNIVARDKGFFSKHGLDVTLKEYPAGPPAVADLLAGKADVAIAADFVGTNNFFKAPNLRILTEVSRQHSFELIARKDHGVENASDLKGKKIGVTKKGHGEFFLGSFLNFSNIGYDQATVVDLPPADIVKGVEEGTLDAGVIYGPFAFDLKNKLGSNAASWSAQGGQDAFALAYSTQEFIRSQPEVITRYLAALVEAETFVKAHPEEAKQLLEAEMHYDPAYVAYEWPEIVFFLGLQEEFLLAMEDQARWLIANKLTTATAIPNYLNFIDFGPLESLKPESITVIR